ncbi:AtpZ/AtpI family protein [uncultured Mitsuokella sp.]|uniref:AtpZ/AtpI family protein n=1 Tax=uncultured Mitsuokella sp. TaxID=453120 RepID=UPI0026108F01|nr:AtpZ/AtpI family protein [uncultured Mitsuokella sp.]
MTEKKPKEHEDSHEGLRAGLHQAVKAFAVLSGVGIYLVVFVGICLFLGDLADRFLLGDGYAGKLIGILIGFPGAFYTLFRQLKRNGVV